MARRSQPGARNIESIEVPNISPAKVAGVAKRVTDLEGSGATPSSLIDDAASTTTTTYSSNRIESALASKAPLVHTHDAADIDSGTLADARVAASNVTQHEAALDHDALTNYDVAEHRTINDAGSATTDLWSADKIATEIAAGGGGGAVSSVFTRTGAVVAAASDYDANQVDFTPDGDIAAIDVQAAVVEVRDDTDVKLAGKAGTSHTHAAADITSGTLANARVAASNVTQHQAAIDHDALTNFVAAEHQLAMKGTWYDTTTQALTASYAVAEMDTELHNTGQFTHDAATESIEIDEDRDLTVTVYVETTKTTSNSNRQQVYDIELDTGSGFSLVWRFRSRSRLNNYVDSASTTFTYAFSAGDKIRLQAKSNNTAINLTYRSITLSD